MLRSKLIILESKLKELAGAQTAFNFDDSCGVIFGLSAYDGL
ncbi:hypothetical protein [Tenacibaculum sp. MAR_2009_124]|nr:hypothetical protein [Tenacibaculum sp. MAR_2009_124]